MTYSSPKRFNAQRAARRALGNMDAQEGVEFTTTKLPSGEWTFELAAAPAADADKPAIVQTVDAAVEAGMTPAEFVAAAEAVADELVATAPAVEPTEDDTVAFLCSVLNAYSDGGPQATAETLKFARPAHVRDCVARALQSGNLTPDAHAIGEAWLIRQPGNTLEKRLKPKAERKPRAPRPEGDSGEPRPESKSSQVVAKAASPEGITNAEIRAITGWTKLGGFFGAVKRKNLVLRRVRENGDTRWFAELARSEAA